MEMVWFNVFYSVPAFFVALKLNSVGRHNLAFVFAFLELLFHQVATTYFTGWAFGAHYWLIYLAGLAFFNPHWKSSVQFTLLGIVVSAYIFSYFVLQEGIYQFDGDLVKWVKIQNAITTVIVLTLLIKYFASSTYNAEQKLIAEKAITEGQNQQLLQQQESLTKEQEKTSRMLAKIEGLFGQQVSQEIAQEMIQSESEIDSKTYDVSVMFLDIRDFTLFADSREPVEVAKFQNMVFGELIEIVKRHNGVVLQILGDGIMAVFGAPVVNSSHAQHAVSAGHEMVDRIKSLGEAGAIPKIKIGIGLNSGKVLAGNVGNESRKFYSLTGTNVIIAARIEQLNKTYQSQFLISEAVLKRLTEPLSTHEPLGEIPLKGIEKPVPIYKLA